MKQTEIEEILEFIEDEIREFDINFTYEIEDNILIAIFKGHFTNNDEIEIGLFMMKVFNSMLYVKAISMLKLDYFGLIL